MKSKKVFGETSKVKVTVEKQGFDEFETFKVKVKNKSFNFYQTPFGDFRDFEFQSVGTKNKEVMIEALQFIIDELKTKEV